MANTAVNLKITLNFLFWISAKVRHFEYERGNFKFNYFLIPPPFERTHFKLTLTSNTVANEVVLSLPLYNVKISVGDPIGSYIVTDVCIHNPRNIKKTDNV
jgi:hypothetical protein